MSAPRKKVLLVDDDPDTADTLALLLSGEGAECRTAYSGEQALDLARHWQPELVILDLAMPVTGGLTVGRRLRAAARDRGAPLTLVAHTAMAPDHEREDLLAAGFDDVMLKPTPVERWLALLHEPPSVDEDFPDPRPSHAGREAAQPGSAWSLADAAALRTWQASAAAAASPGRRG